MTQTQESIAIPAAAQPSDQVGLGPRLAKVMHWSKRVPMIPVLGVMAFADAFVFWNTLVDKVRRDTNWLLLFVVALSLGAVTACHEIGRLAREYKRVKPVTLVWIGLLAFLWLSLGLIIAYIRSRGAFDSPAEGGINELDGPVADTAASAVSLQIAALMLVLYLVTGVLAMGYGYRFNDPRTKAQLEMIKARENLVLEKQRLLHKQELAEASEVRHTQELNHVEAQHDGQIVVAEALEQELRQTAKRKLAAAAGAPSATDEIFPYPGESKPKGGGAEPPRQIDVDEEDVYDDEDR